MKNILLFIILLGSACTNSQTSSGIAKDIDTTEFKNLIQKEAQILDVRTADEFAQGYIEGALNIDVQSADFVSAVSSLHKDKPVLIYCRSGVRSARAMSILKKEGFTELYNLKGGYLAWSKDN